MIKFEEIGSKRYNIIHTTVIDEHSIIQSIISSHAKNFTNDWSVAIVGVTVGVIINDIVNPLRNSLGRHNVSEVRYDKDGASFKIFEQWIKLVSLYDLRLGDSSLDPELDCVYALNMEGYGYNGLSDRDVMDDIDKALKQDGGKFYGQASGLNISSWIVGRINSHNDVFITGHWDDDTLYGLDSKYFDNN